MIVDISNLESMVRGYIINTIKQYYPDIDTSENSPFDDLFIKPMIEFSRPFIDSLSRLELKNNLANAEYLTEAELDEIGEGNYFTPRRQGSVATTVMTLTFANLNLEDPDFIIKVPAGSTFSTASNIEFQTQSTIILTADDLRAGYNREKLVYEIEIPVVAVEIGSKYNVFAGEIMFGKTFISSSLVSSVNKADVIDGKDKEDNISYAERIREFYLSRQLGTAPGYKSFIMEVFHEINDVYVSGYKDKYMERDRLKVIDDATGDATYRHIGGAIDLYLKGCIYDEDEVLVVLNNGVLILDIEFAKLIDTSNPFNCVKLYNLTDSSKEPAIKSITQIKENEFFGDHTDKVKVVIDNTDDKTYSSDSVSQMKIVYSFNTDNGRVDEEYMFNCGISEGQLSGPVKSIDSLVDLKENSLADMNNRIDIIKTGIPETTNETCKVRLKNCDDYCNGLTFRVKFTANKTLRRLKEILYSEQNRIITADIVAKEAIPVPVNVLFRFKPTPNFRNFDEKTMETRIKSSIISYFNKYKLGDSIEESDLVGWIYTDPSVNEMVQYIALPFDAFYIPDDMADDIPTDGSQTAPDGVLNIEAIEYPLLNAGKFRVDIIKPDLTPQTRRGW